jgi:hypothetical protein
MDRGEVVWESSHAYTPSQVWDPRIRDEVQDGVWRGRIVSLIF